MYSQQQERQEHSSHNTHNTVAMGDFSGGLQSEHGYDSHNYKNTTIIEPKYKRNLVPYIAYICFLILVGCVFVLLSIMLCASALDREWKIVGFLSAVTLKALTSAISTGYLLYRKDLFDTQNMKDRMIRLWPFWLSLGSAIVMQVVVFLLRAFKLEVIFAPFFLNEILFMVEAGRHGPYAGFLSSIYRPWVRVREDNSQFGYFPQQQQQGQFASYPYTHGPQQQQYYHDQPFYPQASSMTPLNK